MLRLKVGDRVRIRDRQAEPQDRKSGMFYDFYRGLTGRVFKLFAPDEVALEVELEALPEEVWKRHMNARDQMRERWIQSLPEEARRKLTPEQKSFDLRYMLLVCVSDLERVRARR
jgi:ribosomal protein L21E